MKTRKYWIFFLSLIFLVACTNNSTTSEPGVISNDPLDPTTTDVAPIPTSTLEVTPTPDEPMVATVNGEGIRLQDYEDELRRYEAAVVALGNDYDEALGSEIVLNTMIDTMLLAQAARTNGFDLTTENYDLKLQELISSAGGESQFQEWIQTNFYTQESFDRLYKLEIEATWMRDKIIAEVPTRDEQIRARQILVSSRSLADDIYTQLENGADFDYYAWGYDQLAGGELGWFPREYLVLPEIEQAVFNLQPGEYSQVIESTYGYHIVQVMERALDRSLTQDALIQKQKKAIANWLSSQKESSSIVLN